MMTHDYTAILEGGHTPDPSSVPVPQDVYDLLDDYIDSTTSQLEALEEAALVYEQQHADEQAASIRRTLHKMKGESGMVAFEILENLFHEAENAFERLPVEKRPDMLLRLKDWVTEVMAALDHSC